jgi:hypothetical protein
MEKLGLSIASPACTNPKNISAIFRLVGIYKMNDKSMMEFYKDGNLMFVKWNGQIREALSYKGNNVFSGGVNNTTTAQFEVTTDQKVKVTFHFYAIILKKEVTLEGEKYSNINATKAFCKLGRNASGRQINVCFLYLPCVQSPGSCTGNVFQSMKQVI